MTLNYLGFFVGLNKTNGLKRDWGFTQGTTFTTDIHESLISNITLPLPRFHIPEMKLIATEIVTGRIQPWIYQILTLLVTMVITIKNTRYTTKLRTSDKTGYQHKFLQEDKDTLTNLWAGKQLMTQEFRTGWAKKMATSAFTVITNRLPRPE